MQRFSTRDVPARDRLAFAHDFVARHVAGLQFTPSAGIDLDFDLSAMILPSNVTVGDARYTPLRGARTRELLQDGRDNYLMTIHETDFECSIVGGPPIKVAAGDVMIVNEGVQMNFDLPYTLVKVISLERSRMAGLVPRIDLDHSYHIPRSAPGVSLLDGYAALLRRYPPDSDRARAVSSNHLYDLAALMFEGVVDGGAGRTGAGIKAARLELVKRDILDRIADPELDAAAVARRQGISPRYLHMLFEGDGVTFSEFLRINRLDLAYRLLRVTRPERETISSIAFDVGFRDLSSFNRAFRQRYGATPSDIRAQAMRDRSS
ncbi:helix-turn-helix domain-containing protein [Flaviflagellibacter deserti]|uniref:Helix-turn-helix domain-containing protein n=1 Tax=Flaviflagellibacter deserti TaxID=2267266 RepID=A0ABV9YUK7_9HYPH